MLKGLESIVGGDQTVTKRESMLNYLSDESPAVMEPKPASDVVVVRPKNANEVAAIVKLANQHRVPVFPPEEVRVL